MSAIAEYHRSRSAASPLSSLDDRTWVDLDLDAVFQTIDRTESTLGQQALYHRLRTAPVADHLDAFEALVERMTATAVERERAQMVLARLRDPAGYDLYWMAQPGAITRRRWHAVFPVLAACMLATLLLAPVWPKALMVAVAGIVINLNIRIATARRIGSLVGSFRQIGPLLGAADTLRFLTGQDIQPIVGCLPEDMARLGRLRAIARWVSRDPLTAGDLLTSVCEYLNLAFLLDVNAVYLSARELEANGPALLRVIAAVGDIDAAIGVASFRVGAGQWSRPCFSPAKTPAVLSDVRHPLLSAPVPNSIQLGPPHGVLVTGSNMSGKSTFVRTVGVTAVMAQTVNTCLAAVYHAPIFHVRSLIGRSDDLVAGKSYYIVEVEAVLALIRASASSTPHLFLFDELFRGTNAVERIAAAEAVLEELIIEESGFKGHVVLAATHDGELVELLSQTYATFHLEDNIGPNGLMFEYRLRPGPATTRNALELLRLCGAPESVVARALARSEELQRQRDRSIRGS